MGFLIPLGIKINFLFYPWSAWSRRGLELPAWEKICRLRYTTKHQAKLMYGNWLLLHLPSRSHLHADAFHWQQGETSQRKVFSGCQTVLMMRRQGNGETGYVCQRVTSQPGWDCAVLDEREGPERRARRGRELGDPGSYRLRLSTIPLLHLYLTLKTRCPNPAGLKAH